MTDKDKYIGIKNFPVPSPNKTTFAGLSAMLFTCCLMLRLPYFSAQPVYESRK